MRRLTTKPLVEMPRLMMVSTNNLHSLHHQLNRASLPSSRAASQIAFENIPIDRLQIFSPAWHAVGGELHQLPSIRNQVVE